MQKPKKELCPRCATPMKFQPMVDTYAPWYCRFCKIVWGAKLSEIPNHKNPMIPLSRKPRHTIPRGNS